MEYTIRICSKCGLFGSFATNNICPACNGKIIDTNLSIIDYANMTDSEKNVFRVKVLGNVPSDDLIIKRINYEKDVHDKIHAVTNPNVPKCPSCNSTNISKIGSINRMFSVGLFGLASSKIGKTHKCNNCGTTW